MTPRKKEYVQGTLLPTGSGRHVRHPKSPSWKYSIRARITDGKQISSGQAGPPWWKWTRGTPSRTRRTGIVVTTPPCLQCDHRVAVDSCASECSTAAGRRQLAGEIRGSGVSMLTCKVERPLDLAAGCVWDHTAPVEERGRRSRGRCVRASRANSMGCRLASPKWCLAARSTPLNWEALFRASPSLCVK